MGRRRRSTVSTLNQRCRATSHAGRSISLRARVAASTPSTRAPTISTAAAIPADRARYHQSCSFTPRAASFGCDWRCRRHAASWPRGGRRRATASTPIPCRSSSSATPSVADRRHGLGERLRRRASTRQHAGLDHVVAHARARRWPGRRGEPGGSPTSPPPPRRPRPGRPSPTRRGRRCRSSSGARRSTDAHTSVAADDDSGCRGPGGDRLGDDEVGGETLADAPRIEGDPGALPARRPTSASTATASSQRDGGLRAEHRRVIGAGGHGRRFGHRLQQRHRGRAHDDRSPPARLILDTSLSGRNRLQHASSRAMRIIASSARASPSTPAPSMTIVDRQPIAWNRRTARGTCHCDCSDTTTTGAGGAAVVGRARR